MGRRTDHTREEIKEMAIQAGQGLIEEGGILKFSARKVATKIGYTVGTLYNVFENYDDLVLHINGETLKDLMSYLNHTLQKDLKETEALKVLAKSYIEFAFDNKYRWSFLFEQIRPSDKDLPKWYITKLKTIFNQIEKLMLPFVDDDVEKAKSSAKILWAGVHGICSLGLTNRLGGVCRESLIDLTDSLIEDYIKGLSSTST